jgi:sporulation protein YlmC with PRC-barrel domain
MKKTMTLVALLATFVMVLWVAGSFATERMSKGWDRPYEVSEVTGTIVRNPQGEYLGRVRDFVFDPEGRIEFVVLSNYGFWRLGAKSFAIPFEAFRYNSEQKHLVLDISREKLEAAPTFQKDEMVKQEWGESVYRYYGLQPYWTEKESGGQMNRPMGGTMEKEGMMKEGEMKR